MSRENIYSMPKKIEILSRVAQVALSHMKRSITVIGIKLWSKKKEEGVKMAEE